MNNATTMDVGRTQRLTGASSGAGGFARSLLAAFLRRKRDSTERLVRAMNGVTNGGPLGDRGRFWILQLTFWPLYGMILMVPWIGVFTVSSMLPNKLLVAGTGILAGSLVRPSLSLPDRLGRRRGAPLALMAVMIVGLAWDAGLSLLAGQSVHTDLQRLGSASGVPALAGGFYHALILGLWAMAWLLVRERAVTRTEPIAAPRIEGIVFRDGRKTHVFEADEIEWVRADGDYVVIGAGKRRLMVRATLSGTESKLPAPAYLRIHRSSIVRVQSIREVHPRANNELDVVLRDGTRLRASRRYSTRLLSAIDPRPAMARGDGTR